MKTNKDMEEIKTKQENPNGLHARYVVHKLEGETDPNAEYFVLRLDEGGSDAKHIESCRKAVVEYAYQIKDHLPQLASDIVRRYDRENRFPFLTDSDVNELICDHFDLTSCGPDSEHSLGLQLGLCLDAYGDWIDWEGVTS